MKLDLTKAPTYTKVLPFAGIAAGLALAKYQGKSCMMCYVAYAFIGLSVGLVPLYIQSKE